MIARRRFLQLSGLALASLAGGETWAKGPETAAGGLAERWAAIERGSGGRLGAMLLDSASGRRTGYRQDERFPMCSTFKFLVAAAVLKQVDAGRLSLERRLPVRREDMLEYAPVSARHVGGELRVDALCEAMVAWSDNPAANLLLDLVGGPAGVTAFARALGDPVTRVDRREPEVNMHAPGDPRDTTTPAAMAANLRTLLLGDALSVPSRRRLGGWMRDSRTGGACLRAGLPPGWEIGDKTGSDGRDTRNDIAILWPPGGRAPLLLAAYLTGATVDSAGRDAVLKDVAAAVAAELAG